MSRVYLEDDASAHSFLGLDDRHRLSIIFNGLLRKIAPSELDDRLPEIVSNPNTDLSGAGILVAKLGAPFEAIYEGKSESADDNYVTEKQFKRLARALAKRVKEAAVAGTLLDKGELWVLLKFWAKFGKKGEARAWLNEQLEDSQSAARIIFSSMNITSHSGRSVSRKINRLPDTNTYDVKALVNAGLKHLAANAFSGQTKADVQSFLESVARLQSGQAGEEF